MISWIQRTFQHHFRLIFAILLIGMVIPFIFTIGSTPGIGRAEQKVTKRDFFGHNMLSQAEVSRLMEDTRISADLQYGQSVTVEQITSYMYQRVAAQYLADQLHFPQPTQAEITEFIKRLHLFLGPDGQFDVTRYDTFRSSLRNNGTTEAEIARVIADDARMQKLQRVMAGPGYVMPSDVNEVLLRGDTTWTLSTATVDYASFAPDIHLSDSEIAKFHADNVFRYTIAPRASVDAVVFPATDYTAGIAPTEAEVREYYESNPSLFPKPANAKAPTVKADPVADFAAVQPQVRQALILEKAKQGAVKAASDLAYSLYEGKVSRASLDAFLSSHKVKAQSLAPFTQDAGPAELGGSEAVASAAFELNADRFYSEGIPTANGAVVLIWNSLLPAREPALAEIIDRVRSDATDNQKRIRFVEFGRTLKAGIERRIKSGESFEKAAAGAAGSVKVTVKSYPPFSLRSQPKDVDPAIFGVIEHLDKGSVSDMEATADKGFVVYAADKKAPVLGESNALYALVRLQLADSYARADATTVMRELIDAELKRTDRTAK